MNGLIALKRNNLAFGYELVMPTNCINLDCDEMEYVDGGYQVWANPLYLSKNACLLKAGSILFSGAVTGMDILSIAQEIYAHNVAYYLTSGIVATGFSNNTINTLRYHANPTDISNGGDSVGMRVVYASIWGVYVPGVTW